MAGAVAEALAGLGLKLRPDWLAECLRDVPLPAGGRGGNDDQTLGLVYERFLHSDLRESGAGSFPPNLAMVRDEHLPGPLVVQVDALKNIATSAMDQKEGKGGRTLLLALSDGVQHAVGLEYKHIPALQLEPPPPIGLKIALRNIRVKEGMLLLTRETVQVLGGDNGKPPPAEVEAPGSGEKARRKAADRPPVRPPPLPLHRRGQQQQQQQRQQQQRQRPPAPPGGGGGRGGGDGGGGGGGGPPPEKSGLDDPYDDDIDWAALDVPTGSQPSTSSFSSSTTPAAPKQQQQQKKQQQHVSPPKTEEPAVISILDDDDDDEKEEEGNKGGKKKKNDHDSYRRSSSSSCCSRQQHHLPPHQARPARAEKGGAGRGDRTSDPHLPPFLLCLHSR